MSTETTTARTLARQLYACSQSNDVPVITDGHKAYEGWLRSARDANDCDTNEALESVDRNEFAKEWEACVERDREDARAKVKNVVTDMIDTSIREDRVTRIAVDRDQVEEYETVLLIECEDHDELDFWGERDGSPWRVEIQVRS